MGQGEEALAVRPGLETEFALTTLLTMEEQSRGKVLNSLWDPTQLVIGPKIGLYGTHFVKCPSHCYLPAGQTVNRC